MNRDQIVKERLKKNPQFVRDCCNDTTNLTYAISENTRKDILALKCKKCGAIHRRQFMDGFPVPQIQMGNR